MNSLLEMKADSYVQSGRVIHEDRNLLTVKLETGEEIRATIAGSLHHKAEFKTQLPTVGDYVDCSYNPLQGIGRIEKLLERKSCLTRKVAGEYAGEQVLGTNLDTVFYLNSLNMDLNLRRMERYLIMIRDGQIRPVVILTKADLISEDELQEVLDKVKDVAREVPVFVTSAKDPESFEALSEFFLEDQTVAFLGSSGVGKSTMTNVILGNDVQLVQEIREDDDKGKHTTTSRSLFQLENGCFVMDTPGIREVQLWEGESGLDETFQDIKDLTQDCFYKNCKHDQEPDCAIQGAIESGELCELRYSSYLKLGREQVYMASRASAKSFSDQKKAWKKNTKVTKRARRQNWKSQC